MERSYADLDRALRGPDSTVLAAAVPKPGGGLVGTVMVGHDGHRGWVYYLAVDPAWQGQGWGRRLMTAAEDWVRQRGIVKLQLMARAENSAVLGFYRRLGYEPQQVVVLGRRLDQARPGQSEEPRAR